MLASLTRIERAVPLYRQVFNTLVNEIMNGNLELGSKLNESQLSEQLGVSRTPIREALRSMEAEGWIEGTEGMGYAVFSPSLEDFAHLSECRTVLEGLAAKKMAENAADEEVVELKAILAETEKALKEKRNTDVLEMNHRFHQHIIESSRNPHLQRLLAPLKSRIYLYRLLLQQYDRLNTFLPEHIRIYEAIKRGDSEGAEVEMRHHLTNDRELMEKYYALKKENKGEPG